jgi:hypothetical protein
MRLSTVVCFMSGHEATGEEKVLYVLAGGSSDDYLAGIDMPSSGSEGEEEEEEADGSEGEDGGEVRTHEAATGSVQGDPGSGGSGQGDPGSGGGERGRLEAGGLSGELGHVAEVFERVGLGSASLSVPGG